MLSAERVPQTEIPMQSAAARSWPGQRGPVAVVKSGGGSLSPKQQPVVLLATRQLQVRAIGTTVLEQAGFRVLMETRGESILAELDAARPDLILADEQLDDMHAAQLCSRIRRHSAGATLPILVISDLCQTPALQGILAEEFTDFISAPLNWKAVTFRIHRWISMARKFRALSDQELDLEQVRDSALKASTELLQLRNYDPVTGLPNREMFISAVGLVLSRSERASGYCAVLHLDIDDFKGVNDVLGRALGDELLRIVAKRLQGCLREGDLVSQAGDQASMTSFARLNGDQFAILLGSVADREGAAAVADRLLESLSRPLQIQDRQFCLAARVGIADAHHDDVAEEDLVQRAEIAMRYCKQQKGKTSAFFESFMNELVQKKLELKVELRRALDQEELFLCYQLLVDSRTSVPTGVEGLVRWQHPSRGLVSPGEFLPVAEESDLIVEIDRWVLRAGCRQGKKWLDDGYPPLLISLNVSMRFLEQEDFAQQVLAIVEQTGLPPSSLQLELSERGELPDPGRIMAQFDSLVSAGVHLALDDFGTGQTSLSYLRTLPISCVKVDQSFVRRIPDDSASEAIVTAIVAMSHHLGLKVVAEGVETEDQWRFLAEKEYNQLQGYLFSKPETVARLEAKLLCHQRQRYASAADPAAISQPAPEAPKAPAASEDRRSKAERVTPDANAVIPRPRSRASAGDAVRPDSTRAEAPAAAHGAPKPRPEAGDEAEGQLLQLAHKDFLTKLYNRFSFDERLEHAVAHADRFGHKVALLLIDLDDFKYVNDTHGHAVGDRLLIALAERLNRLVRKVDTLARLGGDEFAVVLSECHDLKGVTELARRLLAELARPVDVEGRELRVTGSLGVAVYPAAGTRAKDLLRQADLALYKAKNRGGNNVRFFAREMDREVQQRLALARDLSGAVERGELFLEYQLQVALETGSIVGVEALLRWDHPARGVIGPERFIPVAESTGEIRKIGRWVIRSACALAKEWQARCGREVPVSVNLSPVQCRDRGFEDTVRQALREHDLPPRLLHLEINERLLQQLPKDFEGSLRRLSDRGVALTLDNFGSGASALEYFQRFRFDRVKIHQSLVQRIGDRSVSASVLSGIVAMARKMEVQIIAEGIEEPEQRERLLAEGCEIGQGFLFGRPMPAEAVAQLMSLAGTVAGPNGAELEPESTSPAPIAAETIGPAVRIEPTDSAEPADSADPEPLPPRRDRVTPREPDAEPELRAAALPPIPAELTEPPAEQALRAEALPPIPAELTEPPAELPVPETAEPQTLTASAELRGLDRYAAARGRGAVKWRIHAVLAVAALAIWSFILVSGPGAPKFPQPVDVMSAAEWLDADNGQRPALIAGPSSSTAAEPSEQLLSPAQPAAAPAIPARQLATAAHDWARAWTEQRVDDYLRFYARDFQPPHGLDRSVWQAQRRARILRPRQIEVQLSALEVEPIDARRARVSFDQSYRSDNYSDRVGKSLELILEDGTWKILAERSAP